MSSSKDSSDAESLKHRQNAKYLADSLIDQKTIETYLHLSRQKNRNILKRILTKYLSYSNATITDLENTLKIPDYKAVEALAHTLKSSSAQVGALGLSKMYERLESNAANHCLENLDEQYLNTMIQLHSEVNVAITYLVDNSHNLINSDPTRGSHKHLVKIPKK